MDAYPKVVGEFTTLQTVVKLKKSIARYGDGEFRLAMGGTKNISQVAHPQLKKELVRFLIDPQPNCIIGIPDMNPQSPKWWFWKKYHRVYPKMLSQGMTYYSQFITRPDSAPWIDRPEFYDLMEELWKDQAVTLVANGQRSLTADFLREHGAKTVTWVQCPYRDAYTEIDNIEAGVQESGHERVLICGGAMATVLAVRLAKQGFHAVDLGHIGNFWRHYQRESNNGSNTKTA